jgi:hypothetical protein
MKLPKRCAISHKKTSKDEGHNRESFIRKAQVMIMYGLMISIMVPLLLMMLSPLAAELQATPWSPSYKPPQLPMYDGHSDPKQFLMSYEATISSYGGNTAVMVKSFVMAIRSVAQTWYYSLRLGTFTLWQKLKDMLVTSFQGFQVYSNAHRTTRNTCRRMSEGFYVLEPRHQRCQLRLLLKP